MRLPLIGLCVLSLSACSSSEVTTTVTSGSGSAQKPSASAAKSAAAPGSASAASPAASAGAAPAVRDADAELKAIDPFGAGGDVDQKLTSAIALCGVPPEAGRPWAPEDSDGKAPLSRCSAEAHAKLFMKFVNRFAENTDKNMKTEVEMRTVLALALDPKAALPDGATAEATAVVAAVKKRPAPEVRLGAVSTSDEATQQELATAAAGEVSSAVRFCYAHGLLNNKALQGSVAIDADVAADGRLSKAGVMGTLPDAEVSACITVLANRSKVNAPSKAPAKVRIPFALSPGGK